MIGRPRQNTARAKRLFDLLLQVHQAGSAGSKLD
jgi:hypothetical protein